MGEEPSDLVVGIGRVGGRTRACSRDGSVEMETCLVFLPKKLRVFSFSLPFGVSFSFFSSISFGFSLEVVWSEE